MSNPSSGEQAKIGQKFEAVVKDFASDGRGVVTHPSGRTMFVPGVWLDERILVRVEELKGRIGFASCVEILEKHPGRITPPCPHHGYQKGECGGCPWMFMRYEEQLDVKQRRVEKSFAKLDVKLSVNQIWPSVKTLGYRNRAQLKTDGRLVGFVSTSSNALAPIDACLLLSDKNSATLEQLKSQLPNSIWKPNKKNKLTTLDIDESVDASEVSVNQRLPFQQANDDQNLRMRSWLKEKLADLHDAKVVLELFCGSGNLTEVVAEYAFDKIVAVEGVESAIEDLKRKQLENVATLTENLFSERGIEKTIFQAKDAEVLILDPPRDGLKVKEHLLPKKSKIRDVLYVSCDLATLVRDVEYFQGHKFKIKEVQPLDMFPQTPHVETLVWLRR